MTRKTIGITALLLLLLAIGWRLRSSGLAVQGLHPDEPQHLQWLEQTVRDGRPSGRLYPAGFFRVVRPIRSLAFLVHKQIAYAHYRTGLTDRPDANPFPDRLFLRRLNVMLSVLMIVLLFLFGFLLTRSFPAALVAATLWTFNPIAIEHAHYATPDTMAVFFLATTLVLWAFALRTGHPGGFLFGCLTAALATGTKFGLVILLCPLLLIPFYLTPEHKPSDLAVPLRRRLLWLLAGLALFVLIFLWTNPSLLHWSGFRTELLRQQNGLQTEFRRALSLYADDPAAHRAARLIWLSGHAADLGAFLLTLSALGFLIALLVPSFRRFRPLLIFFPTLALLLVLLTAPFFRKQEFLLFVPFVIGWSILPLDVSSIPWPPLNRILALPRILLATLASLYTAGQGLRISSFFEWPDSREQARRWIVTHGPTDHSVGVERSADHVLETFFSSRTGLYKVEDSAEGLDSFASPLPDFVIRNTFTVGRGFFDLFSGERIPRHQLVWNRFLQSYHLLRSWVPLEHPRLNPGHYGHGVELYGHVQPLPLRGENLTFLDPLPVLISEQGREIVSPDAGYLGSRWGIPIRSIPREIGFGGPILSGSNLWVTLIGGETDSTIFLTTGLRRLKVKVPARTVMPLAIPRPLLLDLLPPAYLRLQVRARPNRFRSESEPVAFLMPGLQESLLAVWMTGRFDLIPPLIQSGAIIPAHDLFRMAQRTGNFEEARRYQQAALRLLTLLDPESPNPPDRINGVPSHLYDAFARIREPIFQTRPLTLESVRSKRRDPPALQRLDEDLRRQLSLTNTRLCLSRTPLRSGVRLTPGEYTAEMEIRPWPADSGCPPNEIIEFRLANAKGHTLYTGTCRAEDFGQLRRITFSWHVDEEEVPRFFLISTRPLRLACQHLEWRWTLQSRLNQLRHELQQGLARLNAL